MKELDVGIDFKSPINILLILPPPWKVEDYTAEHPGRGYLDPTAVRN